ncbi:50S ribosomal protein L29 [Croceimicrobium sp.]|uniref:50S ribosomal protein L29 n=1 Tax=Croceimicrobium sp. TaxID=2828340 RepID=UPI003BAA295B|tara:strand:- start:18 stop:218 length:201 start_codon:yes stop_codon:yes gene_type:complete
MKASVIREMTTQEISDQVAEEKINYDKLRMAHHISPLENPVELKEKRKLIARLSTELRARTEESAS